jgi:hypothetical protein
MLAVIVALAGCHEYDAQGMSVDGRFFPITRVQGNYKGTMRGTIWVKDSANYDFWLRTGGRPDLGGYFNLDLEQKGGLAQNAAMEVKNIWMAGNSLHSFEV